MLFHVYIKSMRSVQARYSGKQLFRHTVHIPRMQTWDNHAIKLSVHLLNMLSESVCVCVCMCVSDTAKERARETEKMRPLSTSWTAHGYLCLSCFHLFSLIFCVCTSKSSEDKHKHSIPTWHPSDRLSIKISKYQNM